MFTTEAHKIEQYTTLIWKSWEHNWVFGNSSKIHYNAFDHKCVMWKHWVKYSMYRVL